MPKGASRRSASTLRLLPRTLQPPRSRSSSPSKAVLARPREGNPGAFDLIYKPEPPGQLDIAQRQLWELFLFGEKVAEWNYDPR